MLKSIDAVRVTSQIRKDLGDVEGLAGSIEQVGLLQPIAVTPNGTLVDGRRRLEAYRLLGRRQIPVVEVDVRHLVVGQYHANVFRKPLTPSEFVAAGKAIEQIERKRAKERQKEHGKTAPGQKKNTSGNFPGVFAGRARDAVAKTLGVSGRTYEKAKAVVEAAEKEPAQYASLVHEMDRTGKVDRAYKRYVAKERQKQRVERASHARRTVPGIELTCCDVADFDDARYVGQVDAIITDPPYGKEWLAVYDSLAAFAVRYLKPSGNCLVMVGQANLPAILSSLCSALRYQWTLACVTRGASTQVFGRKVKSNWKPIVWLTNGDNRWEHVYDLVESDGPDKRFHAWGQNVAVMAELVERFTVAQELVCDPFCGAGTTGVACRALGRKFLGIDRDPDAVRQAKERIAS